MALNKLLRNEEGQAFILALILLAVGGLIIAPLLSYMSTGLIVGQSFEERMDELYAADAGVEDAIWKLINDPPASYPHAYQLPALNDKAVAITIACTDNLTYKITSTATSDDGSSTTIESYVFFDTVGGVFDQAITANGGNIKLETNSAVNGDVYTTHEVTGCGQPCVNGVITEGGPPLDPGIDPDVYRTLALMGGTWPGDWVRGYGTWSLGPLYITGQLKIEAGATVTVEGVIYVVDTIASIEEGVTFNREAVIVSEGDIEFKSGVSSSSGGMLLIMSVNGKIKVAADGYIEGVLYAPNGEVIIEEGAEVYGAVMGQSVDLKSGATVNYYEGVGGGGVGGGEGLQILTWEIN